MSFATTAIGLIIYPTARIIFIRYDLKTRSSATAEKQRISCAHTVYLGWLADLLMITHSRLVVQCTVCIRQNCRGCIIWHSNAL